MKRLLLILILTFSFQSWIKADDISDFQIEGMSIGDSLLDHVSKKFIHENKSIVYDGQDIFKAVVIEKTSFTTYDSVQVHFEDNNQKFFIRALDGFLHYKNNIEECYDKQNKIASEIKKVLQINEMQTDSGKHPGDKTGKSTFSRTSLFMTASSPTAEIEIICFDNSKEFLYHDKLSVTIYSKEYSYFLKNYYKN